MTDRQADRPVVLPGNPVVAVVVTYQPQRQALEALLSRLAPQVQQVVIVDNGSRAGLTDWLESMSFGNIRLQLLAENQGIAAAQNRGIETARALNAEFVLLMDQDSLPAEDMVAALLSACRQLERVAAVGACYLDARQQNPPPFISIEGLTLKRHGCDAPGKTVAVDYLVASGCLLPMASLETAGCMREDLFIDYVDIEWGLRAASHGLQCYGVCAAHMAHQLGEPPVRFFGRQIPVHTPLRHYYHFRNAVLLYRQGFIPLNWKLVDAWRLLLKFGFYAMLTAPRWQHFSMMGRGIVHGLAGKTGRLDG